MNFFAHSYHFGECGSLDYFVQVKGNVSVWDYETISLQHSYNQIVEVLLISDWLKDCCINQKWLTAEFYLQLTELVSLKCTLDFCRDPALETLSSLAKDKLTFSNSVHICA